jgi:hypothetical protein
LIPGESGYWNPRQRVADYIDERMKHIHATLEARRAENWARAAELEEHVPDPLMPYFAAASEVGSVILYNGDQQVPAGNWGRARIVIRPRGNTKNDHAFEAVLGRLDDPGSKFMLPPFRLPMDANDGTPVPARWVRMRPPPTRNPDELLTAANEAIHKVALFDEGLRQELRNNKATTSSFTIIVFDDEKGYPGSQTGFGCVCLLTRRQKLGSRRSETTSVIRAEAISPDMFSRVPVTAKLRAKKVLLVGCGAIGAFVAVELARAGVKLLTLWDPDVVRPGNSVRWPLGRTTWGLTKTSSLMEFLKLNYPFTDLQAYTGTVGGTTSDPEDVASGENTFLLIRKCISEADIVIDTTGSTEAQQALSFAASETGVPYVMGYATFGAAGGVVATFPPNVPGCGVCMHEHWHDGSLPPVPVDLDGSVAPGGCNTITFTGAGFDLQEVSLQVVRAAVSVLTDGLEEAKPSVSILEHRNENGERILPRWTGFGVHPHDRCCARRK